LQGKGIICGTNCHINIEESAELQFEGILILGRKDKFPHSHQESKLFLGKNAKFKILGNNIDKLCYFSFFCLKYIV